MSQYYLISQLPSLDGIGDLAPLPITEERFSELCGRFLGKKELSAFKKLTLMPSRTPFKSGSPFIDRWNENERELRLALGKVRAEKLNKAFDSEGVASSEIFEIARTASDFNNPLNAEEFLNRYRLDFLESIRPSDTFCDDTVYYYGLRLKLLLRMRQFDKAIGEAEYKRIYSSIINKERSEVLK